MPVYWLLRRQAQVPAEPQWLSLREQSVFAGIGFEKRRRDWLLGRWTAKRAIAMALQFPEMADAAGCGPGPPPAGRLSILAAADGAPEAWLDARPLPLNLTISHRDGSAVCVVAPHPMRPGCDLERIEPRSRAFVQDFFTADERDWCLSRPESELALSANLIWSAKEAALKVLRSGLRADTRSVRVDLGSLGGDAPTEAWRSLRVELEGGEILRGWWRRGPERLLQTVFSDPPAPAPVALGR